MKNVLVVDDNEMQHELLRCYTLGSNEIALLHALDLQNTYEILSENPVDVILLDNRLLPYSDYTETAPLIREAGYDGVIAVMSADVEAEVFSQIEDFSIAHKIDKGDINNHSFHEIIERL